MSDFEMTIAAKDMASETVEKFRRNVRGMSSDVIKARQEVQSAANGMNAALQGIVAGGAAGLAIKAVDQLKETWKTLSSTVNEGLNYRASELRLELITGEQSDRLKEFTKNLETVFAIPQSQGMDLITQADNLDVLKNNWEASAFAAIGYSQATGKSLSESMVAISNSIDDEEKLAEVRKKAIDGLKQKLEVSDELQGSYNRLAVETENLKLATYAWIEPIERLKVQLQTVATVSATNFVNYMQWMDQSATDSFENVSSNSSLMRDAVLDAIDSINAGIITMPGNFELTFNTIAFLFEKTKNDMVEGFLQLRMFSHAFTSDLSQLGIGAVEGLITPTLPGGLDRAVSKIMKDDGTAENNALQATLDSDLPQRIRTLIGERERELATKVTLGMAGIPTAFETAKELAKTARESLVRGFGGPDQMPVPELMLQPKKDDDKDKDKSSSRQISDELQAVEGRLLTRGRTETTAEKQLQKMDTMIKIMDETLKETEKANQFMQQERERLELELIA